MHALARPLGGGKGHLVVEIEVVLPRGHPPERTSHPAPIGRELGVGCAGDRHHAHVTVTEMDDDWIKIVGPEGTMLAARCPVGRTYIVIDDELAAARKQVRQRLSA